MSLDAPTDRKDLSVLQNIFENNEIMKLPMQNYIQTLVK